MLFQLSIITISVLIVIASPLSAFAKSSPIPLLDTADCKTHLKIDCPMTGSIGEKLVKYILLIVGPFLALVTIIAIVAITYGGFKYIASTGDEAAAKSAKMIIVYAIIGLMIVGISGVAINAFINIPTSKKSIKPESSVLFDNNNFWEGTDVLGDSLSSVVIAKLLFPKIDNH